MSTTYGVTRTLGSITFTCEGYNTHEEALNAVYSQAFNAGEWSPPKLRAKWYQFWRPTEHTELEKSFLRFPHD